MHIVGLPRSMTAWLSVFMSQSGVYFYHEAIDGCSSIEEYKKKIKGCGDSTTAIGFIGDTLTDKTVIITKNKDEFERCVKWSDSEFNISSASYLTLEQNKLNEVKGLVIKQSEITEKLQDIWEFLVDTEWDDRYSNMVNLNIQVASTDIDEKALKELCESI